VSTSYDEVEVHFESQLPPSMHVDEGDCTTESSTSPKARTFLPLAQTLELPKQSVPHVEQSDFDEDSKLSSMRFGSFSKLASEGFSRNDFSAVVDVANIAIRESSNNTDLQAEMRLLQARSSFWLGDPAAQERYARESLLLARAGTSLRFQAVSELAAACSTLGNLEPQLDLVDEIAQVDPALHVLPDYLIACCRLGIALQRAGWPEHAERVIGRVQEDLHSHGQTHPQVRAWTLLVRAELADHAGDHANSLMLTQDAAQAFCAHGDSLWACVCRGNAARSTLLLGGYEEARSELLQAIERASASHLSQVTLMRLNLGLAEARAGDLNSAISCLRSSIDTLNSSSDWRLRSTGHRYLAEVLWWSSRFDEAEHQSRIAIDLAAPSPALRAQALAILAQILLQGPRAMEAFMAASQAMEVLASVGGVAEDEARIRLVYAIALDAMGHARNAKEAFDAAKDRLLARADRISDLKWRGSFLKRVREHERTLALANLRCSKGSTPSQLD
jgi:tetratricopeptide (TPR) repeat protein